MSTADDACITLSESTPEPSQLWHISNPPRLTPHETIILSSYCVIVLMLHDRASRHTPYPDVANPLILRSDDADESSSLHVFLGDGMNIVCGSLASLIASVSVHFVDRPTVIVSS